MHTWKEYIILSVVCSNVNWVKVLYNNIQTLYNFFVSFYSFYQLSREEHWKLQLLYVMLSVSPLSCIRSLGRDQRQHSVLCKHCPLFQMQELRVGSPGLPWQSPAHGATEATVVCLLTILVQKNVPLTYIRLESFLDFFPTNFY